MKTKKKNIKKVMFNKFKYNNHYFCVYKTYPETTKLYMLGYRDKNDSYSGYRLFGFMENLDLDEFINSCKMFLEKIGVKYEL